MVIVKLNSEELGQYPVETSSENGLSIIKHDMGYLKIMSDLEND